MFLVSSLFFFVWFPCGRLSWLHVSFWAHVNIVHHIISYVYLTSCVDFIAKKRSQQSRKYKVDGKMLNYTVVLYDLYHIVAQC